MKQFIVESINQFGVEAIFIVEAGELISLASKPFIVESGELIRYNLQSSLLEPWVEATIPLLCD